MQFTFWNAMIDIGFWTRLAKKKIEQYKLEATLRPLTAKYRLSNKPDKTSSISIDAFSFTNESDEVKSGPVEFKLHGSFLNTNTVEQFQNFTEENEQKRLSSKQISNIKELISGKSRQTLTQIFLLVFGDLKKHTFQYQFYSVALPVKNYHIISEKPLNQFFQPQELQAMNVYLKKVLNTGCQPCQFTVLRNFQISSIKQFIDNSDGSYVFVVADTTNFPKTTGYHTSTCLAVFVELLANKLVAPQRLRSVKVILMKEFLVFNLQRDYAFKNSEIYEFDLSKIEYDTQSKILSHPKKVMDLDLKSFMDERSLAKQAVDLNIKLMKWRLLPTLDIPKIQAARCLLFGAGTLGCQLARNLIGWGVKNITFIDYSRVSYSNPVRQTLYDYEDTTKGGKIKAETAAQKLKKIYPEINAHGFNLSIPMPGHFVTKSDHIKETFETINILEKIVSEHDVLFLLLDSREARWLPTVLANKYDKACITVGLGFDSFVVVRHGVSPLVFQPSLHRERICCYFCNDIVTPQNTMKDRTLDQMCTVTKPGLSFVSAAYAAELYISLLHHPLQHHAPANEDSKLLEVTDIGKLPHHLRGNMSDYQTQMFYGKAFQQCVACSKFILDEYVNNRQEFILKVLNDPSFIHQVVHLKEELEEYAKMESGIIEIIDDDMGVFEKYSDLHQSSAETSVQSAELKKKTTEDPQKQLDSSHQTAN